MATRLEVLGGLRVLVDGTDQRALTRQYLRCGLLVYAGMERSAPRERVLGIFWPDRPPERARHTLSQMLYELRRDVDADCVSLEGDLVVAGPGLTTDAAEFEAANEHRSEDVIPLYRGPFLDATRLAATAEFEQWAEGWRRRLGKLLRQTQRARIEELTASGNLDLALSAARAWASAEPLDDEAQLELLQLLALSGLQSEALRHFEAFRARLDELDATPTLEISALVEEIRAGRLPPAAGSGSAPSPRPQPRAYVMVLPFEDMSRGRDQAYFCDGLTEETMTCMSRLGLRVAPRTSAFAMRGTRIADAAQKLGTSHAVEGSARIESNSYRVTVRLIEARSEQELWGDQLQGELSPGELFAAQDRVAAAISKALRERLSAPAAAPKPGRRRRRPPANLQAYRNYHLGRHAWFTRTPEGFQEALRHFEAARNADPTYAPAHSGIADVYCLLGAFDYAALAPGEAFPKARAAAERAIQLDPELASAHATLGNVLLSYHWNLDAAEACYRRAIALDPGYSQVRQWYSTLLLYKGREKEAFAEAESALKLDRHSAPVSSNLARLFQLIRQPRLAAEQYRHALSIDPEFPTAQMGLALSELSLGDVDVGLARLETLVKRIDDDAPLVTALEAYALGVGGYRDRAADARDSLMKTPVPYLPPEHVAIAHLGVGDLDEAVVWLTRAHGARSQVMPLLRVEPILDCLRGREDFEALLASIVPLD